MINKEFKYKFKLYLNNDSNCVKCDVVAILIASLIISLPVTLILLFMVLDDEQYKDLWYYLFTTITSVLIIIFAFNIDDFYLNFITFWGINFILTIPRLILIVIIDNITDYELKDYEKRSMDIEEILK